MQFILVLLFINFCMNKNMKNPIPIFAIPCVCVVESKCVTSFKGSFSMCVCNRHDDCKKEGAE